MPGFEQATIKVEKEQEYGELQAAINRVFVPETVEKYLKQVQKAGLRVRDLEPILQKGVLEKIGKAGKAGMSLYKGLTLSDQAQMREFYLSRVEEVAPELRAKYQKIYRYYE